LGSGNAPPVRLPQVALVGGEGVSATSYGAQWYHLEQDLGLPFDAISRADLTALDLGEYDVILLPDLRGGLDEATRTALHDWVEDGGRLVAMAGAAAAVAPIAEVELRTSDPD